MSFNAFNTIQAVKARKETVRIKNLQREQGEAVRSKRMEDKVPIKPIL
jgi:hypothetical protein